MTSDFTPLSLFLTVDRPLGTNFLSLPNLPQPLKSKMAAMIFVKKILSTRAPKLRLLCGMLSEKRPAIKLNVTSTFIPATPLVVFSTDRFWCVPFLFYSSPLFHVMQVSNHTKDECPLTIISCPYAGMDCTVKVRNSCNRPREMHHVPYNPTFHLGLLCIWHCQDEFWKLVFCSRKCSRRLRNEADSFGAVR